MAIGALRQAQTDGKQNYTSSVIGPGRTTTATPSAAIEFHSTHGVIAA